MRIQILLLSLGIFVVMTGKGQATEVPLQEISHSILAIQFDASPVMALAKPDAPSNKDDAVRIMAMGLGLTTTELLSKVHNGVGPKGGTCPPLPIKDCTAWLSSKTMMHDFLVVYQVIIGTPLVHSCAKYGSFALKVYSAREDKFALGDVLETISSTLNGRQNEAKLLQGVAIATYADGSLDRAEAFNLGYGACDALSQ